MKMGTKINMIFFLLVFCFANIIVVNAVELPDSLSKISQAGTRLFDSACGASDSDGDGNPDCYGMAVKWSETTGANICTQYSKTSPAVGGVGCTKNDDWTPAVRYAVAKVIQASGIPTTLNQANANYFAAELAINQFLNEKGVGGDSITGKMTSTYSTLYNSYLATARNANYETDSNVNITLSASELTFTLNGSNYESNSVKVNEGSDFTVSTSIGTVVKELDSFKVLVPTNVLNGETTIKVTVTRSKTLPQARNYTCDSYQSLTPVSLEDITKSNKKEISGTITPLGKLIINKYDENNNPLSGATILVSGAKGYNQEFITNGSPIVIENLEYDTYAIEETNAPSGYIRATAETVVLTENNLTATINIVNNLIKIDILKVDENDEPLEGAIIKLMDKDGNTLQICKDESGNNTECRWVTTDESYKINGIPAGTYYLKEISTPKGYNVNPNKIKIIIDNSGKVTIDNKVIKNNLIKISNELTTTKISKISAVNGKELPGATLEILNSKKEKISCIIKNEKGEKETLKECKWVSKDKATVVLGLDVGKYYLSETIAPEGYELNTNMVEFEIKADGTTTEVEMKNELVVKVPDTLSARSALLIAISMFDIALGIGIITYVKKNKVQE